VNDGEVDHLKSGAKVPPVVLPATDGSEVSLAILAGRSIVAVYPWTGRPGHPNPPNWDEIPGAHGSTPELEGLRDHHADFARLGVRVYGLSRQTTDYQREMAARLRLPFLILSDAAGSFAASLRLPSFAAGGVTYLERLTLVVSGGIVESVVYPVPDPARHAADLLPKLAQITSSSVSSTE
jgi:peroxiredoxin